MNVTRLIAFPHTTFVDSGAVKRDKSNKNRYDKIRDNLRKEIKSLRKKIVQSTTITERTKLKYQLHQKTLEIHEYIKDKKGEWRRQQQKIWRIIQTNSIDS